MDVIMQHQQEEFRSTNQFSLWVSRNRSVLALQATSLMFFIFLLLVSFRVDFSSFFNLGRTHMFILCNGIVAILVKGSVLTDREEDGEVELKKIKNVEVYEEKSVEIEKKVVGIEEQEEKIQEIKEIDEQLVEEDLQEENGFEELSLEELNKKCDEFIRRMRGVISNEN